MEHIRDKLLLKLLYSRKNLIKLVDSLNLPKTSPLPILTLIFNISYVISKARECLIKKISCLNKNIKLLMILPTLGFQI